MLTADSETAKRTRTQAEKRTQTARTLAHPRLLPDYENRERPGDRRRLTAASTARRRRRCRPTLHAHREQMPRFRIERDRARADHRFERLLDGEIGGRVLLQDRQRAVAVRAERFHRR